jgi:hypothetical protein
VPYFDVLGSKPIQLCSPTMAPDTHIPRGSTESGSTAIGANLTLCVARCGWLWAPSLQNEDLGLTVSITSFVDSFEAMHGPRLNGWTASSRRQSSPFAKDTIIPGVMKNFLYFDS